MRSDREHIRRHRHGRQLGALMLEIVMALAIAATATLGFLQLSEDQQARTRATVASQQALTIGQAMQSYINDRYALLLTQSTATQPALVTVADLVAAGYLPTGTSGRDVYGMHLCTLVIQVPGAPSARLQGLLVAESATAPAINDVDLGRIVTSLGGAGGGVYSFAGTAPGSEIRGAGGAWALPVGGVFANPNHANRRCDGSTGRVALSSGRYMAALWYGKVFNNEDVLYARAVPGRADLNTMKTPLGLLVDTTGSVAYGRTCTQVGQIAADGDGVSLTCRDDGTGTRRWSNSYYVDRSGSIVNFGAACTLAGSYATDASGVPMVCKGGRWGNFYYMDTSGAAGVAFGKPCDASMTGSYAADATGVPLSCKSGYWVASVLPSDASVALDAACPVNGSMSVDTTGVPYVCRGGLWKRLDGKGSTHTVNFRGAGTYRWLVPAGVNIITLSMVGGGESGVPPTEMNPNDGLEYSAWMSAGGASGGYLQDYPVNVQGGTELCITVGEGGNMVPPGSYHRWILASHNRGSLTSVEPCSGTVPTPVICYGGGLGAACNVQPSSYARGRAIETGLALYGFDSIGGRTPFEEGWGGSTQIVGCGFGCNTGRNASFGQPGGSGAVYIHWVE